MTEPIQHSHEQRGAKLVAGKPLTEWCTVTMRNGLLSQLAASPATVPGTPPNSPTGVSWPVWPTAQPNSFCASA